MSVARTTFCDRLGAARSAIADFKLQDLPLLPGNVSHNNSARIIRNGLAVQCFNIFEDFVKARSAEVLSEINSSGVPFSYLPEDFRWASTVDAVNAITFQAKLRDKVDRISYTQQYSARIASTSMGSMQLPDIAFFHASPNISKESFRDALAAFSIDTPWAQISGLCSRIGISGMPSENVFSSLALRRHHAAHNAGASVSEADLLQSMSDATGLALCFDILVSKATRLLVGLRGAVSSTKGLIVDHKTIPLRFIKASRGYFREEKEGGKRSIRRDVAWIPLVAPAVARSQKENGALVIFDASGVASRWVV